MKRHDDPEVAAWLATVEDDLRVARLAMAQVPPILGPACFHAQQAAEKAIKAVLAALGDDVPRTHDVAGLVWQAAQQIPEAGELREAAAMLTPYAVAARYPVLRLAAATIEEARHALECADRIVGWVSRTLR